MIPAFLIVRQVIAGPIELLNGQLYHFTARSFPACHTAEECCCAFETCLIEKERRTGARMFVRSGTVRDDAFILRQTGEVACLEFVQRKIDRPFGVGGLVRLGTANIDDDRLAIFDKYGTF